MFQKNTVIIDCSTIDVETSKKVCQEGMDMGITMIDAPVSGGVNGAKLGTLSFMVGCSKETFSLVESLLLSMGKKHISCRGFRCWSNGKRMQ